MAIEYSFELQTDLAPKAVAEWIERSCAMRAVAGGRYPAVAADGIVCVVMSQSDVGRRLVADGFGIRSSVTVICRIDKFERYDTGMRNLVALCAVLLRNLACDLVMLSHGERGMVLRKGGEVQVDCREKLWRTRWDAVLAEGQIPFVARDLPSL